MRPSSPTTPNSTSRFLNAELDRSGRGPIASERVVDTLMLARRKHPAGPNSLDALCARYLIDASRRTLHGALLDAELLSEVYVELIGGRQAALLLGEAASARRPSRLPPAAAPSASGRCRAPSRLPPRRLPPTAPRSRSWARTPSG